MSRSSSTAIRISRRQRSWGMKTNSVVLGDVVEVAMLRDDVEEVVVGVEFSPPLPEICRPEGGILRLFAEALDLRQGAVQNFDAPIASVDLVLKIRDEVILAMGIPEFRQTDFEIADPLAIPCHRFADLLSVRLDDVPVRTGSVDIEFGQLVQQQSHDQGALGHGVAVRMLERQCGQGCGVDLAGQGLAAAQEFYRIEGICHFRRLLGGRRLGRRRTSPRYRFVLAKGRIIEIAGLGPVFEKVRGTLLFPADNRRRAAGKAVDLPADPVPQAAGLRQHAIGFGVVESRPLAMTWVEAPPSGVVMVAAKPPTCPGNPVIFPPGK